MKVLLAKLTAFVTACALSAVFVVNTLTNPIAGETVGYRAIFTDAMGLLAGSEVRVAGVRVGTVNEVVLVDGHAEVSFEVVTEQPVPADTVAVVRYADLLGSRYLAIAEGSGAAGELAPGGTIPVGRTRPPLDLTALFNGFKPLFEAIDPGQVNQLARQIVAVLQGEGGTVTGLLNRVVSLTSTLTSRDQVIGEVLRNMNAVLATMTEHRANIKNLVDGLAELASATADSRDRIVRALDAGAGLARSLARIMTDIGPGIAGDVRSLKDVTGTLMANQRSLEDVLGKAPGFLGTMNRTLDYGSWVNVYVCNLSVRVAGDPIDLGLGPHSEVCR